MDNKQRTDNEKASITEHIKLDSCSLPNCISSFTCMHFNVKGKRKNKKTKTNTIHINSLPVQKAAVNMKTEHEKDFIAHTNINMHSKYWAHEMILYKRCSM